VCSNGEGNSIGWVRGVPGEIGGSSWSWGVFNRDRGTCMSSAPSFESAKAAVEKNLVPVVAEQIASEAERALS
jgi:hypothetical protein